MYPLCTHLPTLQTCTHFVHSYPLCTHLPALHTLTLSLLKFSVRTLFSSSSFLFSCSRAFTLLAASTPSLAATPSSASSAFSLASSASFSFRSCRQGTEIVSLPPFLPSMPNAGIALASVIRTPSFCPSLRTFWVKKCTQALGIDCFLVPQSNWWNLIFWVKKCTQTFETEKVFWS